MADKMQITIVGLGLIGASAGLALHKFVEKVTVVGHDKNSTAAGLAKKMGAVDRTEWNLINAVGAADRILLTVPPSEVRDTLAAIAQDLKPGCVIVDTTSVKRQVLTWAGDLLPPNVTLVGGHPVLLSETQDTASARADLFEHKIFCLTSDARTSSAALQLATDLVEALGAQPFFVDPVEHDGLAAAVEHLPAILAGALGRATSQSSGWQEMRKLAGSQYYSGTYIVESDAKSVADACLANAENTLRWIDNIMAELGQWRTQLAAADQEGLAQAFEEAITATNRWARAQETGNWEEAQPVEYANMGTQLRRMFGFGSRDLRNPPKPGQQRGK